MQKMRGMFRSASTQLPLVVVKLLVTPSRRAARFDDVAE